MDVAITSLFAPILDKLARQDSGDGMLFRILKEITGKYSIQQSRAIKQPDPQSRADNTGNDPNLQNIFTEFKKLYRDILRDQSYRNDYKLFLKKILDRDLLESAGKTEQLDLIPGVDKPLLVVIDGLTKKGAEDFKDKLLSDLFKDLKLSLNKTLKDGFGAIKKEEQGLLEDLLDSLPGVGIGLPGGGGRDRRNKRPRNKRPGRSRFPRSRGRIPIPPILPGGAPKPASVPKGTPPLPAPKSAPVPKGAPPLPAPKSIVPRPGATIPKGAGSLAKGLGAAGAIVGVGLTAYEISQIDAAEKRGEITPQEAKQMKGGAIGGSAGGLAGGFGGAAAGAAIGTLIFPGVGTAIGGIIGGIAGGIAGGTAGEAIGEAVTTSRENQEIILDETQKYQPPNSLENKITPDVIFQEPPIPLKEGGLVMPQGNKPTLASIAEPGNPEVVTPVDKLFDAFQTTLNTDSLDEIASNTKDTNKALGALADAIVRMVTVFNQKTTAQGGTTIINAGGSQQTTSASMAANLNSDPIRRVRSQFMS